MVDGPPTSEHDGWLSNVLGIDVRPYLPSALSDIGAASTPMAAASEEPPPQYPPDWQHGAPTKPVAPDPHVWPPEPPPQPPGGPYRDPAPRPQDDDPGILDQADKARERIKQILIGVGIGATLAGILAYILIGLAAVPALAELRKHDLSEDQVQAVASAMGWSTSKTAAPPEQAEGPPAGEGLPPGNEQQAA